MEQALRRCGVRLEGAAEHVLHARQLPPGCFEPGLARALYLGLLVHEDGAASSHNLGFALQLLELAERALGDRPRR
ncbi:MAG: hypothetical protein QM778_19030 [Myxococcales bacterium]